MTKTPPPLPGSGGSFTRGADGALKTITPPPKEPPAPGDKPVAAPKTTPAKEA